MFLNFPNKKYNTIVVDPPWPVKKTGLRLSRPNQDRKLVYETLSLEEISSLPVKEISTQESYIFLWATNKTIEPAFELLRKWEFKYHAMLTWAKPTGVCPFGPFQMASEFVLFGIRDGSVFRRFPMGSLKTWFEAPVTKHSEKPDKFYEMIVPITAEPRIDLFARKQHEGFDSWGNQVEV